MSIQSGLGFSYDESAVGYPIDQPTFELTPERPRPSFEVQQGTQTKTVRKWYDDRVETFANGGSYPKIRIRLKGSTGEETVNYGYFDHEGTKHTKKSGVVLSKTPKWYNFAFTESTYPQAAWVEFTNDGKTDDDEDKNVIASGLELDRYDMWDPTYNDWPGNDNPPNKKDARNGTFAWNGTYRMGFDLNKIPDADPTDVAPEDDPFGTGIRPVVDETGEPSDPFTQKPAAPSTPPTPPVQTQTQQQTGIPMWAYFVGAAALGLAAFFLLYTKKKKTKPRVV